MDLTIDTNVLVNASGEGAPQYYQSSIALLRQLADRTDWRLCVDKKGKIVREYDQRRHDFCVKWRKRCAERLCHVDTQKLPKGTRVDLQEAHFDWKDYPFVETAFCTGSRILVTCNLTSFTPNVRRILKRRLDVAVYTPEEFLEWVIPGWQPQTE